MFFDKDEYGEMRHNTRTTRGRYLKRKEDWDLYSQGRLSLKDKKVYAKPFLFPQARHRLHWILHNFVAHFLICFFPHELTFHFHDKSSAWLSGDHKKLILLSAKFNEAKALADEYRKKNQNG